MRNLLKPLIILLAIGVASTQELPPGEMFDVGGHNLHMYCIGDGGPVVILDAGVGDWSLQLRQLQVMISEFTRVCAYDRGGYGWSDAGAEPRDSEALVSELVALLAASGEQAPYILVGHSFAGINAVALAHDHPELVAGIVMLDASHPQMLERLAELPAIMTLQDQEIEGLGQIAEAAAAGAIGPEFALGFVPAGVPEDLHELWAEQFLFSGSLEAAVAEYAVIESSLAWLAERHGPLDTPVRVVARGAALELPEEIRDAFGITLEALDRFEAIWRELQEEHATLSGDSVLVIAGESQHYVHYTEPELVVEVVRGLVD